MEAPPNSVPVGSSSSNVLSTYEDCQKAVEQALDANADAQAKQDVLKRLQTFFETRIAKKASKDEKEGAAYVKRAVQEKRSFTPFKAREKTSDENKPGGGLFANTGP